jgi:hypothetical protein
MLVRTPPHKPMESLLGYVLRVSEANGYDTPWHVLAHAGFRQGEMNTAGFPVEKLAKVLGQPVVALKAIAYIGINANGEREFKLLGHSLGKGLMYDPLRLNQPCMCPHCVEEQGYVDAFWDLSLAVACPRHQCTLVTHCPVCSSPLTWYRPGLLTCKCGASLHDAPTQPIAPALADLMAVLWAKVHGATISPEDTLTQPPVAELLSMQLHSLLRKLPDLGRMVVGAEKAAVTNMPGLVERAAGVLAAWPAGFRQFLGQIGTASNTNSGMVGFRKKFEQFYTGFFKSRTCGSDFIWLRDEFVRFGIEEYGDSVIDNKLLRGEQVARRFVPKAELARSFGISPVTLGKWERDGLVEMKRVRIGSRTRYIADITKFADTPLALSGGSTLKAREAAAYLAVPVSVLQRVKTLGHMPGGLLAKAKHGYRIADLDAFRQKLLALSPFLDAEQAEDLVDMARVLRESRFHSAEGKAGFVLAYLSGDIRAFGRTGDTLKDIQFRQADVAVFVGRSRAMAAGDSVSLKEAAVLVGCDARGLPGLLDSGHLIAETGREGLRVSRESIARFSTQYVALSSLAKEVGTSSRRLLRLAKAGEVNVLLIDGGQLGPVPFFRCEDVSVVRRLSEQSPARKPNPDFKLRALIAVSQYLAGLRAKGELLPRCGTKLNKRVIAQACGLDRSVFYNNEAAVKLLESYVEAEIAF